MKISGIIWFYDIIDKLEWKHHVSTDEVEQVLLRKPHIEFKEKEKQTQTKMFMSPWAAPTQAVIYLSPLF